MYQDYKPLRNRLRQLKASSGLETIYAFSQLIMFGKPLPQGLHHPMLDLGWSPLRLGLLAWDFEQLAREIILNASEQGGRALDWQTTKKSIDEMHALNGLAYRMLDGPNVLHELYRIGHQQFPFQRGPSTDDIARHFLIYNHPSVSPQIEAEFGMKPVELFQVATALTGHFLDEPYLHLPANNELNNVAPEVVDRFLNRMSRPLAELRDQTRNAATYDANWTYYFDPLRLFPLVRFRNPDQVLCPMPTLLHWRTTDGLFFDLVNRTDFAEGLGRAFESLVGEILRRANRAGCYRVIPEERYGPASARKDTADWIVAANDASIFIECKARRASQQMRFDLSDLSGFQRAAELMASYVVQLYATLTDALEGQYPSWTHQGEPIFLLIATLSEWFVHGQLAEDIANRVEEQLAERGLDVTLPQRYPYIICTADDLETIVQLGGNSGFHEMLNRKSDAEHRTWLTGVYLSSCYSAEFREHCQDLFPEVMNWIERGAVPDIE